MMSRPNGHGWGHQLRAVHYDDFIMSAMASQITSLTIVYLSVYADQRKLTHHSVRGGGKNPSTLGLGIFAPHLKPRSELIAQYRPPMSFRYRIIQMSKSDKIFNPHFYKNFIPGCSRSCEVLVHHGMKILSKKDISISTPVQPVRKFSSKQQTDNISAVKAFIFLRGWSDMGAVFNSLMTILSSSWESHT